MAQRETLLPNRFGILLAVALLIFGALTRNLAIILLVPVVLLVRLPVPRLQRILYIAIYFSLATAGVLLNAVVQDTLSERVYVVAGCLGLFAIGGYAAYADGKKHPEKNPDFSQ